jgi:hypothetical protein
MRLGPTRTTPPPIHDPGRQFPELAELRRTTVRLHPRAGTPELAGSKLGGDLAWPAGELWPLCREPRVDFDRQRADHACHVGVLQLCKEDVPELGFPPGKDVFQMTWCPRPHHEPGPRVKVFWRSQ